MRELLPPDWSDAQRLRWRETTCTFLREKPIPERMIDSTTAMAKTLQIDTDRAEAIVGASIATGCPEMREMAYKPPGTPRS